MADQQQQQLSLLAYRLFIDTCRSQATRQNYLKGLRYFMDYLQVERGAYDKLLPPEKDSKIVQMDICDFISHLQKKGKSSASVSLYIAAVSKFYAMNDVTLNWKKIKSFMGEHERVAEDRPYTHSEIQLLLNRASSRNKAIILLMSSAGLRVGAVPSLRIRDLEPIDKYNIYKVNVYAKSKKHGYFSFCTPECRNAIDSYLEWRKRFSERFTDETPLFRRDYNVNGERIPYPIPIAPRAIMKSVKVLLLQTGLREIPIEGQKYKRTNIMMCHGFRKFFETNAFKAGMDHMYLRRLMGQKSGLEDAYLKLSDEELLEGDSKHVGFIGIVDQLTIDETNKLKHEVETLTLEKSKVESALTRIDDLYKRLGLT